VVYDIPLLLTKHKACINDIANHFSDFFKNIDYSKGNKKKIKTHTLKSSNDLDSVLSGPGFYLIATDVQTQINPCTLTIGANLKVVYRGHSYNVRERIESHLFYNSYLVKNAGRKFTVCMKLDRNNINIDKFPYNENQWVVVTHSMPKSTILIREAAEVAFDGVFEKPVGSYK